MPPPPYPPPIKTENFTDKLDESFAGTPPEARVARSAASGKHHNTLVPPAYGISWLQIEAGSAKSKSMGGTEEKDGKSDFHYAPSVEDLTLKYKVNDPKGVILGARLELYRQFDSTPLWKRDLTPAERADGDHSFKFELGADPNPNFPDLVPTAEHSPYKLKITTSSKVRPQSPCAWTFFQVLVHDVVLELGDKKVLPADGAVANSITPGSHRTLYDTLSGKLPKENESKKLELLGNLFKTASAEMYNNAAYDNHKTQWDTGPLVPIFAKLRVRKSDDKPVEAPLALGNVKCLWDWEDVPENNGSLSPKPALFVGRSVNYDRNLTKPKGDNCHKKHGGKRNETGTDDPIFPTQAGYDPKATLDESVFPFKVEAATKRTWAALSSPWRKEALAGKTGVFFQPSRMGGDVYTLACYVAWEKDKDGKLVLDIEEDLKDKTSLKVVTGKFEVWRKHVINRYIKKKAFARNLNVGTLQAYYDKAFVNLHQGYNAPETMDAATYNSTIQAHFATLPPTYRAAVDPAVDQHANGDHGLNFRSYADYLTALRAAKGWSQAMLNAWLASPAAADFADANAYEKQFGYKAGKQALIAVADAFMPGTDGVTICQFIGLHNIGGGGSLNGSAIDVPSATRQRVAFLTCATANAYTGNANTLEQTTTHEIGHHLFMPHGVDGISAGAGPDPSSHDKDDRNCTMSYNFAAERRWCGLCILRLRGWDKTNLDKDGTKNTHP